MNLALALLWVRARMLVLMLARTDVGSCCRKAAASFSPRLKSLSTIRTIAPVSTLRMNASASRALSAAASASPTAVAFFPARISAALAPAPGSAASAAAKHRLRRELRVCIRPPFFGGSTIATGHRTTVDQKAQSACFVLRVKAIRVLFRMAHQHQTSTGGARDFERDANERNENCDRMDNVTSLQPITCYPSR